MQLLFLSTMTGILLGLPPASTQHSTDWRVPEQMHPLHPVLEHPEIMKALRRYDFVTLHIPKGYYPNAFFLFIHIPKSGGTTFNVRTCPKRLESCGMDCGCGNCATPTYYTAAEGLHYPVLNSFMNSSCPMLSYEMNYDGFKWAYHHPVPHEGRPLFAITFIREPYNFIRSQLSHYISFYRSKTSSRQYSDRRIQCVNASQHFNESSGCNRYHLDNGQTSWLANGDINTGLSIIRRIFGLGITEYHEESMCIFQFQLGQFNKKRCNCNYLKKIKRKKTSKIWNSPLTSFAFEAESGITELMMKYTRLDNILWAGAMKIFAHRLRYLEEKTQVKLLCPDDTSFEKYYDETNR